ncbi:hypothetical protein CFC21_095233 [Triticum aestivum]|uniref:Uncharacterized protein n=2 Tax=Triticum aestivum TaxID=4565 RepID=A0A3B6RAY7_WHEAT|nr:hypothetical protein CFC21_095233 [Triticum aestivum]
MEHAELLTMIVAVQEHDWPRWIVHQLRQVQPNLQHLRRYDWPFFCRVEPKVFEEFFGVPCSKFDREACSACVDNIKMVYGQDSPELGNLKRVIREESSKQEASMNRVKLLDTTNTGT